ncbi:MAG: hypothetical protein BWY66_01237 [bacterium ADurb.Bin374]|nr:MAG: hypothetical protein BWY66_01237 [bacterium ADurb.Bin374]
MRSLLLGSSPGLPSGSLSTPFFQAESPTMIVFAQSMSRPNFFWTVSASRFAMPISGLRFSSYVSA